MSKVAEYLRGHISGEVTTRSDVCDAMSTDMGVLRIKPEMVIYPRTTNDIRKITRFAWQLAEKGHVLPITVRGAGTDSTGAAIGKGVSLVTTAHFNTIFEYDPKQKLVRLQPGVTIGAISQALSLHGVAIPSLAGSFTYGTVGGAIASGVTGPLAGKYGPIGPAVQQLEVVLASGDVLQTGRISKRELNRRKGLQGFEGDIYRGIDGIIEENGEILDSLRSNDAAGYNSIADVKQKDGSFDLTPLFVGSQGTLGIITEMIMRTEFHSMHMAVAGLVFASSNAARDALDDLCKMSPTFVEYFDAELFENAAKKGRHYTFYQQASDKFTPKSVILIGFDEFNERKRQKHIKKIAKAFSKADDAFVTTGDDDAADELNQALDVTFYTALPDQADQAAPNLFGGFHVPTERLEDFSIALAALAKKEHIDLPMAGHVFTNTYTLYPAIELRKVSDKQKVFKLLDELTKLVYAHSGTMIAEGGEGRLKGSCVFGQLDERVVQMYADVRKVCDPFGTLNPGVKDATDTRHLAEMLRESHDAGQIARFGL